MFKSYASKITSFLIENKEINQDDYEVYKYGFEVLIAFIVNIAIVLSMDGWSGLVSKVFYSTGSTIIFVIFYLFIHFVIVSFQDETIQWLKEIKNKKS